MRTNVRVLQYTHIDLPLPNSHSDDKWKFDSLET